VFLLGGVVQKYSGIAVQREEELPEEAGLLLVLSLLGRGRGLGHRLFEEVAVDRLLPRGQHFRFSVALLAGGVSVVFSLFSFAFFFLPSFALSLVVLVPVVVCAAQSCLCHPRGVRNKAEGCAQ